MICTFPLLAHVLALSVVALGASGGAVGEGEALDTIASAVLHIILHACFTSILVVVVASVLESGFAPSINKNLALPVRSGSED